MGILNFSWFDVRRKMNRVKQAGRGGPGTILRNKKIKAIVVRYQGIGPNNNDVANMELLRKAGTRINTEIQKLDENPLPYATDWHRQYDRNPRFRRCTSCSQLSVWSDPQIGKINSYVWKDHFTQGLFDGCWIGSPCPVPMESTSSSSKPGP